MSWGEDDVRLVPVEWLKAHEEINPKNMEKLLEKTLKWDGFTKPLEPYLMGIIALRSLNVWDSLEFLLCASNTSMMIPLNLNCGRHPNLNQYQSKRSLIWLSPPISIRPKPRDIASRITYHRSMYRSRDSHCSRRVSLSRTDCRFPQAISFACCNRWVIWLECYIQ